MSPFVLDFVYLTVLLFGLPFVIYKALTSRRFRAGWGERFGGVPDLRPGRRIWVHCASVGEVLVARTLVARLESECPQADVVISTNTITGRETAQKSYPEQTVFYFPLDFSTVVRRVFRRVKPSVVVLVELELWPNFLQIARRRHLPVVVVNGRITQKSVRRYRLLGPFARRMFANVRHFAVQNDEYAERIQQFGVGRERISVSGTMKYDAVPSEVPEITKQELRRLLRLGQDEPVILGGCTHPGGRALPGEDELLIDYVKHRRASRLRLILAPRHLNRVDAVEKLIREAGLLPVRKTAIDAGRAPEAFEAQPHVILVDTMGELAQLYSVATVVFVGGSLVRRGGQNMIEPAALGKPVVFGPHTWNFRQTVERLVAADAAVQVDGPDGLTSALDELRENSARRTELGARAAAVIEQGKGATERNFEAIRPLLQLTT